MAWIKHEHSLTQMRAHIHSTLWHLAYFHTTGSPHTPTITYANIWPENKHPRLRQVPTAVPRKAEAIHTLKALVIGECRGVWGWGRDGGGVVVVPLQSKKNMWAWIEMLLGHNWRYLVWFVSQSFKVALHPGAEELDKKWSLIWPASSNLNDRDESTVPVVFMVAKPVWVVTEVK